MGPKDQQMNDLGQRHSQSRKRILHVSDCTQLHLGEFRLAFLQHPPQEYLRYWNFLAIQNPWTEGPTHSDKVSDLYPVKEKIAIKQKIQ